MSKSMNQQKNHLRTCLAGSVARIKSFRDNRRGSSLLMFGIALPVLLGVAGLGYDATIWYMTKRQIQTVADNAALTGVYTLAVSPGSQTAVQTAVEDDAVRNDFDYGAQGKTIQAFTPPSQGPNTANTDAVEVIVTQPGNLYFSSLMLPSDITISARSVAALTNSGGGHCLLALDETAGGALTFQGNTTAQISCGIASNSVADDSILVAGNATLTADPAQAVGGIVPDQGNGTLNTTHHPQPYSSAIADPYYSMQMPDDVVTIAALPCNAPPADPNINHSGGKITINGAVATDLPAGRWCEPFVFKNGADVTLAPGVHIFDGIPLTMTTNNATLRGTGVTIFITADPVSDTEDVDLSGGTMILSAPGPGGHVGGDFDGMYAGMLLIQDPDATAGTLTVSKLNGNTTMDLEGALYFPNSAIDFRGGASNGDGCIQIVAATISISGDTYINNDPDDCAAAGVQGISAKLVLVLE